jgi:hypothetical protein
LTLPISASPDKPEQLILAVTVWPASKLVGVALRLQNGLVIAGETVIATEAGITVPVKELVVSITLALSESVGLLAEG